MSWTVSLRGCTSEGWREASTGCFQSNVEELVASMIWRWGWRLLVEGVDDVGPWEDRNWNETNENDLIFVLKHSKRLKWLECSNIILKLNCNWNKDLLLQLFVRSNLLFKMNVSKFKICWARVSNVGYIIITISTCTRSRKWTRCLSTPSKSWWGCRIEQNMEFRTAFCS